MARHDRPQHRSSHLSEGKMSVTCSVFGHLAGSTHTHAEGLDFATCHACGCDLMRSADAEWTKVPDGFSIVWREFGRADEAAMVAERLARIAPDSSRRPRRGAWQRPRNRSKSGMLGVLRELRGLLETCEHHEDTQSCEPSGQYVIHLPAGGVTVH
jgi:hypothetical protein